MMHGIEHKKKLNKKEFEFHTHENTQKHPPIQLINCKTMTNWT